MYIYIQFSLNLDIPRNVSLYHKQAKKYLFFTAVMYITSVCFDHKQVTDSYSHMRVQT